MSYAINWDTAESRIKDLKNFLLEAPQQMDPIRLRVLDEVYDEYSGEPHIILRARLLEKLLMEKGIFLDGNPIVGTTTGLRAGVFTFPEFNVNWIKDDMDMAKMCSLGEVAISDETNELLKKTYKKWKKKTFNDRWQGRFKEVTGLNFENYVKYGVFYNHGKDAAGLGTSDYTIMLHKGISGILAEIEERIQTMPCKLENADKLEFYRACKIALNAVIKYAHRYADLAEETAKTETDPKTKAELLEIAEICRWVPEYPARNFREAVQSFWFAHLIIATEQMGCGISPGRYGQYMYPYYQKDIENGMLTREQAMTILKFQWIKHLEFGVYQGRQNAMAVSGHTGQTITLGGVTADGLDATTELEEVILDVQIAMRNIQPTLSIFYHPRMKESFLMKAVELIRDGSGQPQFINNDITIQRHLDRFADRNITLAEARNCVQFGCVGTGVVGGSYALTEHFPNLTKFVELVLYDGADAATKKQISIHTGDVNNFKTFEEFYQAYLEHVKYFLKIDRIASDITNAQRAMLVPSLMASVLSEGCIENGKPLEAGGARFLQSLFSVTTGIDAANSLLAIKHLIYDTKQLTLDALITALQANFEGYEHIQQLCLDAPKHGNDNKEADAFVRRLYKDVDDIHNSFGPDSDNRKPRTDAYSLSYHNYFGSMMEATPNGRKRGQALTDGSVSATPGTDKEGITALIKSAANAIDTVQYGSNHLNVKFIPSALEGPSGARRLLALVKTYFDLGGGHIQFNCVKSEKLKQAQEKPEDYKNLVVRVAGFSAYFTRLDQGVQNEIIKRTEYGE